jgi:hypothetical protein
MSTTSLEKIEPLDEEGLQLGLWPCAEKYTIEDGCIFTATTKSGLRDVWAEYEEWMNTPKQGAKAPYQGLLDLVFDLREQFGNSLYGLTYEDDPPETLSGPILDWYGKHGFLGILPQQLLSIQRPPVWLRDSEGTLIPHIVSEFRTSGGWRRVQNPVFRWTERLQGAGVAQTKATEGALVVEKNVSGGWPQERINLWPLTFEPYDVEKTIGYRDPAIEHVYGRSAYLDGFFLRPPGSDEPITLHPTPNDPAFWSWYCEPLDEFYHVAHRFCAAVGELTLLHMDGGDAGAVGTDFQFLTDLANTVGQPLDVGAGAIEGRYWAPSLLAAYAFMVLRDAQRPGTLHQCLECHRFFASRARRVSFCGPRCKNRVTQRRLRESRKTE